MFKSFMNEHSVELILVPRLIQLLSNDFSKITPICFWASREGNKLSMNCYLHDSIIILALFPRRPKVDSIYDKKIIIKFNETLFEASQYFKNNGIFTIAGAPLISSLDDFTMDTDCMWFSFNNIAYYQNIEILYDINKNQLENLYSDQIHKIDSLQILKGIETHSKSLSWHDAINIMNGFRHIYNNHYSSIYNIMGGYKPVYLLLQL